MSGKTNVFLVHGYKSEGAEKDFSDFIKAIDQSRYNVIPFNYDYDAPLAQSADKLAAAIKENGGGHVLAHSMGGLVARGAAERLADDGGVKSLTTLATPWNGHGAAFLGKYLPGGVPSNADMVRGSEYQRSVSEPIKGRVSHRMFVADKDGRGDDDGTVSVDSQTKRKIALDAESVRTVQDTHSGILRNPEVIQEWVSSL